MEKYGKIIYKNFSVRKKITEKNGSRWKSVRKQIILVEFTRKLY